MATHAPLLRPLSIAEIIDAAFRIYRRNFGRLVAVAAVVYVPLAIVEAILMAVIVGSASHMPAGGQMPTGLVAGAGIGAALVGILAMIGYMLAYAAMTVAISRTYLGQDITPGEAYQIVMPSLGSLILTAILVTIVISIGFMLCLIPGIYLAVALSFAIPVVVLEGLGATAAMGRSMDLVRGYWLRVAGTMVLLGLIVGVIQMAILWPLNMIVVGGLAKASPAVAQAVSQIINALASMVLFPLSMTGLVVLYYDLRVRKEGFDLQLMTQQIGTKIGYTGPPPAGPAAPTAGAPQPPAGESTLPPPPGSQLPPPPTTGEQQQTPGASGEQQEQSGQGGWQDDEPKF